MKKILVLFITLSTFLIALTNRAVLPVDEAFKIESKIVKDNLQIDIELGKGIYIYKNKLKIEITEPKVINITEELNLPKPTIEAEHKVFEENLTLTLSLSKLKDKIGSEPFSLLISLQGCSKGGICYSPIKKSFNFGKEEKKESNSENNQIQKSEQDLLADILKDSNIFVILFTFFLGGLALSLTPCIFPMIPILSSIIASQSGDRMNAKKGFMLSLVYVLAMSITYTIAGVLAGLFGSNIQSALQTPWVLFAFSAIFVALAFSMFGYYDIEMPKAFQRKITKKSEEAEGHGVIGVAIMGFLSALIVGPCVAAPLAGALIYIGQTGDALLGGLALFVLSLGMGVPLLIIGAGAGKYMPKPGGWMDSIKAIFGVVLLGVAIWMISRVIAPEVTLFLWSLLFISSAIYMGLFEPFKENISGIAKFIKVIAFFFLLYGISLFVGSLTGAENPLKPFEKLEGSRVSTSSTNKANFIVIKDLKDLNNRIENSTKPIMIDFYADWCVSCKELEETTFKDNEVLEILKNFTLLKVDVTKQRDIDKILMKKFKVIGPPAIIFYKDRKELKNLEIVGYKNPKEFVEHLKRVQNYKIKQSGWR